MATDHNVCIAYLMQLEHLGLAPQQIVMFQNRPSFRRQIGAVVKRVPRYLKHRLDKKLIPKLHRKRQDNLSQLRELLPDYCQKHGLLLPDYSVKVTSIINRHKRVRCVVAKNINCKKVIDSIKSCPQEYIIFCGGGLLRREILALPKRFIHIHPGVVPDVKGADGILWSSLVRKRIGMSAFFMNQGIDTGDIIQTREYDIPQLFAAKNESQDRRIQIAKF
ncbi:MAG: formyltransferase family protein, partial [Pirellulaceae bacterium]|nr:formyltransferase family protein [Pirellulaceae bacterium]